jgi:hypothetical protein
LALRYAIARKIQIHRRWAPRLFITASGVWFLRIGYKFWYFIEDSFGSFLIPLAVLELHLRTKDTNSILNQLSLAILLMVLSLMMSNGIFLALTEMWLPRILKVI